MFETDSREYFDAGQRVEVGEHVVVNVRGELHVVEVIKQEVIKTWYAFLRHYFIFVDDQYEC